MKHLTYASTTSPGLFRKTAAIVATAAAAAVALMVSAVAFAIILIAGAIGWAYLWWKTREFRRQVRNFSPRGAAMAQEPFQGEVFEGEVIEGVAVHVDEHGNPIRH